MIENEKNQLNEAQAWIKVAEQIYNQLQHDDVVSIKYLIANLRLDKQISLYVCSHMLGRWEGFLYNFDLATLVLCEDGIFKIYLCLFFAEETIDDWEIERKELKTKISQAKRYKL